MKLWLLEQEANAGYDTFDACVVAAETYTDARRMLPSRDEDDLEDIEKDPDRYRSRYWTAAENVVCTLIGEATAGTPKCVKCASFNAG